MKRFLREAWEVVKATLLIWGIIAVGTLISVAVCLIIPAIASVLRV